MDIIKLAQIYDNKGNYFDSDRLDNVLIRMSKSETGKDLIEGVEWKNPDFSPQELQRMEREIYPSGFHTYDEYDASGLQGMVEELPEQQRTLGNIKSMFEDALSDETDKLIVDGEPNKFYFVLEVDDDEKLIEAADLTIMAHAQDIKAKALKRLYRILKPYSEKGYSIYCDLRHSTSWPMMKKLVEKGWIVPEINEDSPVRKVEFDESGKLTKLKTNTHYLGGERMHEFKGVLRLP